MMSSKKSDATNQDEQEQQRHPQQGSISRDDDIRCSHRPTEMHLVVTNISKRRNVRALLQTAVAMGCASILVVGQQSFDLSTTGHDLPTALHEPVRSGALYLHRFDNWSDCVSHLRERNIRLVGVEIHADARPITAFLDGRDTAFVMGNEGDGLHDKQLASCDAFVRIPQYGGGTASLNVYVAASIVLHRFHHWQQQEQQQYNNQQWNDTVR